MTKLNFTSSATLLTSLHGGTNAIVPKALSSLISTHVAKAGAKLDICIHAAAVAVIHRSMPIADGGAFDCSMATKLLAAMPNASRSNDLIAWFTAFSNIRFDEKGNAKLLAPSVKAYKPADPAAAMLKPFWTPKQAVTSERAFLDRDFAGAIARLVKKAKAENAKLTPHMAKVLADLDAVNVKADKLVAAK